MANYPELDSNRFYQDIMLLDGTDFKGNVDLFVGGSPCQSFSSVGFQGGLEDARGTLFYEFARLVKEIEPKVNTPADDNDILPIFALPSDFKYHKGLVVDPSLGPPAI